VALRGGRPRPDTSPEAGSTSFPGNARWPLLVRTRADDRASVGFGQDADVIKRSLPFSPRTTRQLECGDLIAVPCDTSGWACLQVIDLQRAGPGSLTTFVAGALPWHGETPPSGSDVAGLAAVEQGLIRTEIFTEGGLQVTGKAPVVDSGLPSNLRDFAVGTTHHVWGWRTAISKARAAASAL
jgi:hypothetical protein